jgi:radical SAM superfamily enzyme YgiQ (UPF0313 family)
LIFGKGVRRAAPQTVIRELEELRDQYQFASFMFHDDCLTEDHHWVTEFCRLYQEEGFSQPFFCQSRADIIARHPDMVAMMAEAGLRGYFIGFESGNQRILNLLRKGTKVEHNFRAAEICRVHGLVIWANYMMGMPTETKEEVMDTVNMIREIDPDYYSPAFFTPHPGTDLYDYVAQQGLSLIENYDSYRRNPTEPKIKGQDYEFLAWALERSQKRTTGNQFRRTTVPLIKKYGNPANYLHRLKRMLGPQAAA